MTQQEIYESETGEKATYRKDSADYHTLRYVKWLESRPVDIQSEINRVFGVAKKKNPSTYMIHISTFGDGEFQTCSICAHHRGSTDFTSWQDLVNYVNEIPDRNELLFRKYEPIG